MKPIYTLGICNDETSSACLFKDGELVSAASEERFSRIKLDNTFPQQAINFVLSHSNICFNNLTISHTHGQKDLMKVYCQTILSAQNCL